MHLFFCGELGIRTQEPFTVQQFFPKGSLRDKTAAIDHSAINKYLCFLGMNIHQGF